MSEQAGAGARERILASYWLLAGAAEVRFRGGTEVSPRDLRERIEAAGRYGYCGIGLTHQDLDHWGAAYSPAEIRRMLDANGLDVVEIEMLFDWFTDGERRQDSDVVRAKLMNWARELRAHHIKVGTDFEYAAPGDPDRLAEEFAGLCRDAAEAGTTIALEPVLPGRVTTPEEGLAMIEASGAVNAGLIIDVWHIARANLPYSALTWIPLERLIAIELCDGTTEAHGDWLEETVDHRLTPGEGEFDVPEFVRAIKATGYDGAYGVEVISREIRAETLEESAAKNFAAARRQLQLGA